MLNTPYQHIGSLKEIRLASHPKNIEGTRPTSDSPPFPRWIHSAFLTSLVQDATCVAHFPEPSWNCLDPLTGLHLTAGLGVIVEKGEERSPRTWTWPTAPEGPEPGFIIIPTSCCRSLISWIPGWAGPCGDTQGCGIENLKWSLRSWGWGYEDKAGGGEEKGASTAPGVDRAQTHHPPTRLGVEEQLLQTGNHGYGEGG